MNFYEQNKVLHRIDRVMEEIYNEGYHCGMSEDENEYFRVWSMVIIRVIAGEAYSDDLLTECDEELMKLLKENNNG